MDLHSMAMRSGRTTGKSARTAINGASAATSSRPTVTSSRSTGASARMWPAMGLDATPRTLTRAARRCRRCGQHTPREASGWYPSRSRVLFSVPRLGVAGRGVAPAEAADDSAGQQAQQERADSPPAFDQQEQVRDLAPARSTVWWCITVRCHSWAVAHRQRFSTRTQSFYNTVDAVSSEGSLMARSAAEESARAVYRANGVKAATPASERRSAKPIALGHLHDHPLVRKPVSGPCCCAVLLFAVHAYEEAGRIRRFRGRTLRCGPAAQPRAADPSDPRERGRPQRPQGCSAEDRGE